MHSGEYMKKCIRIEDLTLMNTWLLHLLPRAKANGRLVDLKKNRTFYGDGGRFRHVH